MYSLGIDIGSSSVKVSLLDVESGAKVASATHPAMEAPIHSPQSGWAEQDPDSWWRYLRGGLNELARSYKLSEVAAIGISYQMHGLVAVDKQGRSVRESIIWCDSRAVQTGEQALREIGPQKCSEHLLNSPGNFTASKLAWVKRNEREVYDRIWKFMLPGDYIAYRLTGEVSTTASGLSEGILWDFKEQRRADFVADYYGIEQDKFAPLVPSIGIQGYTSSAAQELGLSSGIPVSYRAGDQPNNAFSLNVLRPGEIAATAGTSGVVYGVSDLPKADPGSRVNSFLHVAPAPEQLIGVLLCINGTGVLNSWAHRYLAPELNYPEMNEQAAKAPVGSDGLRVLPFGNGAERMLGNRTPGARFVGVDLIRHKREQLLRAVQEGIAFSFRYGIDIMKELGLQPDVIRAGRANLFLSPLFRSTLATCCDARIELYDTDGALGAARGAALGAGIYSDEKEAFASLRKLEVIEPQADWAPALEDAYCGWKSELENIVG